MKPTTILAAFAVSCLVWLPACEAATRSTAKQGLLLRKSRTQKQEPFIVSFRVSFTDGLDNVQLAKNLSARINTPHDAMAGTLGYSVARVFNGTFPPVAWAPSTTAQVMALPPTQAPEGSGNLAAFAPVVLATTPAPSAMKTAMEALRLARQNRQTYDDLTKRMTGATAAHADALSFGNPSGITAIPTQRPQFVEKKRRSEVPHTLGRLIYDAFVNTPRPIELTTPMPTPAVPAWAVDANSVTGIPNMAYL